MQSRSFGTLQWLTAVQYQHHLMQLIMEQCWSLREFVETTGVVLANLEVASGAPVIQATLGNTAMKVCYFFIKHVQVSSDIT